MILIAGNSSGGECALRLAAALPETLPSGTFSFSLVTDAIATAQVTSDSFR